MKQKDKWIDAVLIGSTVLLALGLFITTSRRKVTVDTKPAQEDPFDTTELTSSYPYMHSRIKK
jgi:hypothetical protein